MAGPVGQVVHVSELYETVTMIAVLFLFIMELFAFCFELFPHLEKQRMEIIAQQNDWARNRGGNTQSQAQNNAVSQLNKQISTLQRQASENQKSQRQQNAQQNNEPPKQIEPEIQKVESKKQQQKKQQASKQMSDRQKGLMYIYMLYQRFINQHTPIILAVLVAGLMTNSTYIFTLACYFCYLFCNVLFDFIQIEQKIRAQYKRGIVVSRLVKLSSSLFIIAIFVSYIINVEF